MAHRGLTKEFESKSVQKSVPDSELSEALEARLRNEPRLQHIKELSMIYKLGLAATHAKEGAYCPYSNFHVGAAFLHSNNKDVFTGANVENASYPVTICAERVALPKAVADGHRDFRALAVATDIDPPASPCGMCRQFMNEFCKKDMPIVMLGKDSWEGIWIIKTMGELLPDSFGPGDLPPTSIAQAQDNVKEEQK